MKDELVVLRREYITAAITSLPWGPCSFNIDDGSEGT